jgi:hypothetical protein
MSRPAQQALGRRLVHEHGPGQGAHTGVGQVGGLEQALELAILAAQPVKGEHRDVELHRRAAAEQAAAPRDKDTAAGFAERQGDFGQFAAGTRIGQVVAPLGQRFADQPFAARCDIDRERHEALLVDRLQRLQPSNDADIVLGRAPAEKHRDTGFILARHPVPQSRMSPTSPMNPPLDRPLPMRNNPQAPRVSGRN